MSSRQLYVDDRDPSIIYFSSAPGLNDWSALGTTNEFMNSTSHSAAVGSGANFTFSGSLITVFGTVSATSAGAADPITQYILDSNAPVNYQAQPTSDIQYNVQFYQSSPLNSSSHTLQIIIQSAGHFFLDYVVIAGDSSLAFGQCANTTITNQPTTTLTSSERPTPKASATDSGVQQHDPPDSYVGIISSEILGGALCLVILLLLAWYIHRKRSAGRLDKPDKVSSYTLPDLSQSQPSPTLPSDLEMVTTIRSEKHQTAAASQPRKSLLKSPDS